ncbi:MAG TPA: pirin family protein [Nitrospiraceae bacterium]|nr:pirin family protein [Nitrospiraceae bacterium]
MRTIGQGHVQTPAVDIRRASERFHTQISWLDSWHSFSFSNHYDPANTHHGLLLVSNDDIVLAGTGFRTHPHQNREIVTWVLDGDARGAVGLEGAGVLGRGDAVGLTAAGSRRLTADRTVVLTRETEGSM